MAQKEERKGEERVRKREGEREVWKREEGREEEVERVGE